MKVLVTGAKGFIGKHVCLALKTRQHTVYEYDLGNTPEELEQYIKDCDWIVHLAGVMRPQNRSDFSSANVDLTEVIANKIVELNAKCSIIFTSSIQAVLDNDYGSSKLAGEQILQKLHKEHGVKTIIFRLTNAFGKWCRPNYNSVVSTFCYNIANDLPIQISDPAHVVNFIYIDDIVKSFVDLIEGVKEGKIDDYNSVTPEYPISLGDLADMIRGFKDYRKNISVPSFRNELERKMYATYLSFLPEDQFAYDLNMHKDNRGSFTEFIRTPEYGQVSVNVAHPGITKGNHYHWTKNERFLTVQGQCSIKFRKIGTDKVIEYIVDGKSLRVVDIPPGYVHNITAIGDEDAVTIMWANEPFDPENPDTYYEEV